MSEVLRDELGRVIKGSPSLNPHGARRKQKRKFTSDQVTSDFLGLLDEPVTVKVKGVEQQMPAILAIYRKLVQKAAEGDWQAMKMVIELRAEYSDRRTEVVGGLIESVVALRRGYAERGEPIPEHLIGVVEMAEESAVNGQFRPG